MTDQPRPSRPARFPDLTALIDARFADADLADAVSALDASSRAELAARTAAMVVAAARRNLPDAVPSEAALVGLADDVGMETLAALWRDAEPVSLAGALWILYLLRQWCRDRGEEITQLWRAGEGYAPAEAAVAGVGSYAGADQVREMADAVLRGAYQGDFAVALERAAAFFRVVAAGRAQRGPDAALAAGNERAAEHLAAAARAWRAGTLR
ncbi:MAG: hypothetical protein FWD74_07045 [Actinomycetia bacterium]|nr:hypothetical protein [Actinomycetes bacterium]